MSTMIAQPVTSARNTHPLRRTGPTLLVRLKIAGLAIAIVAAAGLLSRPADSTLARQLTSPTTAGAYIEIGSASARVHNGFVEVVGTASNRGVRGVRHLEATVELLDDKGRIVNYECVLVGPAPFVDGEQAAFRAYVPASTAPVSYRIRFRELGGRRIASN